ncbi:hypothetical protein PM082_004456 [Marasmius tenuissimus]|nr:hypothetical protein PM082_004456 [Marasmius tenuissimus]
MIVVQRSQSPRLCSLSSLSRDQTPLSDAVLRQGVGRMTSWTEILGSAHLTATWDKPKIFGSLAGEFRTQVTALYSRPVFFHRTLNLYCDIGANIFKWETEFPVSPSVSHGRPMESFHVRPFGSWTLSGRQH